MVTNNDKGPQWWRSQRYILSYLLFGMMMNIFLQRINLSIAIICMVNHTALKSPNIINQSQYGNDIGHDISLPVNNISLPSEYSPFPLMSSAESNQSSYRNNSTLHKDLSPRSNALGNDTDLNTAASEGTQRQAGILHSTDITFGLQVSSPERNASKVTPDSVDKCSAKYITEEEASEDGPFVWSKEIQGLLLGAVFWTYFIVQIPGNHLVRHLRKKLVTLVSMVVMTIMTMLTHVAALHGPWLVFAIRLIEGACTAFAFVAIYGIWARWAPPKERASLISFSISGQMLGNMLAYPLSALLCKYGFLGGWPSVFYVFGMISFVLLALYFFFAAESPSEHPFISVAERKYIESSLAQTISAKQPPIPWLAILTSPPFWAVPCGQISFTWGIFLLSATLPQYMNEVLKFDIKSNGVFNMLPYLVLLFTTQAAGRISDLVIRRKWLSPVGARKLCIIIANLTPAALLAGMSFLDCTQPDLAITLLVIGMSAKGFSLSGFLVLPYDIAPAFATVLMTISNSLASIPGFVAPYVVAAITKDQTREQWQTVFFLTSGVYVLGAIGFCLLARGEVQPWARNPPTVMVIKEGGAEEAKEDGVDGEMDICTRENDSREEKERMLTEL